MSNPTLDYIFEQYQNLKKSIEEAKELLQFSQTAGNDVSKQQAQLRTAMSKLEGYRTALKGKGYDV